MSRRCCTTPSESWYIRTTQCKDKLLSRERQQSTGCPEHIQDGRFGNWLANNLDWALGRERYWGTPLPIWICDNFECRHKECIGSVAELTEKTGKDQSELDLHRPYVDEITWAVRCAEGTMKRVPELMDVWFDSGAMPWLNGATHIENQEICQRPVPAADYICEAIDQTRGWFYSLHAISTLLFNSVGYSKT